MTLSAILCMVATLVLFRQAFELLCRYPAQEISYTKLLGQLQDKGNTDLIKYYLELYAGAFLIYSLEKYSARAWLARSASRKKSAKGFDAFMACFPQAKPVIVTRDNFSWLSESPKNFLASL